MLPLPLEGALFKQVSLESKKKVKKLVSILATSTPMMGTTKAIVEIAGAGKTAKVVETAKAVKTTRAGKNNKESEGDENPRSNLT